VLLRVDLLLAVLLPFLLAVLLIRLSISAVHISAKPV
jgi:hypothetical protein